MAKKTALMGMCIALALVLGWLESLVPVVPPVSGIKLGLANVVSIFLLYRMNYKEASVVALLRVLLSGILFGNFSMLLYSLAGAFLSILLMSLLKASSKFSVIPVSIVGGVAHNLGQLIVAVIIVENGVLFYYLPVLILAGAISGALIGLLGALLIKHIPDNLV